jgi:hypothetical protein
MRRFFISVIAGLTLTGILVLWAYINYSSGHPHPLILKWLLFVPAVEPICDYLPQIESESLRCSAPLILIASSFYSILIFFVARFEGHHSAQV